ncbi:hypothetical protein GCM10020331_027680 [Ectobacillus funiculus]
MPSLVIGKGWISARKTREIYADVIRNSKLVIWNGPMGVFELDTFAKGTKSSSGCSC